MKYIITEQQLDTVVKKFNKENVDRGKLGHRIEELVLNYFERPVCDVVAIFMPKTNYDDDATKFHYIVLIMTPDYYGNSTITEIKDSIENYIGINTHVIIVHSQDCDKIEE
jgi:hypothetical protein